MSPWGEMYDQKAGEPEGFQYFAGMCNIFRPKKKALEPAIVSSWPLVFCPLEIWIMNKKNVFYLMDLVVGELPKNRKKFITYLFCFLCSQENVLINNHSSGKWQIILLPNRYYSTTSYYYPHQVHDTHRPQCLCTLSNSLMAASPSSTSKRVEGKINDHPQQEAQSLFQSALWSTSSPILISNMYVLTSKKISPFLSFGVCVKLLQVCKKHQNVFFLSFF